MCLQCFIFKNNQNGCVQCEKMPKEISNLSKRSADDDFDNFDEDQLFDEWNESESISQNETKQTEQDFLNSIYDDETESDDDDDEANMTDSEAQPYQVQWLADVKNDVAEFSSDHNYPHTKSMLEIFGNVFGLKQVHLRKIHFQLKSI